MRVRRVLIYEGPPEWVRKTLTRSYVIGKRTISLGCTIEEVSITEVYNAADNQAEADHTAPDPNLQVE